MLNRRTFLKGLVAAPAIITTPGLLMPVKSILIHQGNLNDYLFADDFEFKRFAGNEVLTSEAMDGGLTIEDIKNLRARALEARVPVAYKNHYAFFVGGNVFFTELTA